MDCCCHAPLQHEELKSDDIHALWGTAHPSNLAIATWRTATRSHAWALIYCASHEHSISANYCCNALLQHEELQSCDIHALWATAHHTSLLYQQITVITRATATRRIAIGAHTCAVRHCASHESSVSAVKSISACHEDYSSDSMEVDFWIGYLSSFTVRTKGFHFAITFRPTPPPI